VSGPPRRWAVCADDFAIDPGAVEGIASLVAQGRVTATSALVDAPAWRSAVAALPDAVRTGAPDRGADLGLHLNLTQSFGAPGQRTWPLAMLIARCAAGAMDREVLRSAIARQLDAFEDATGRAPDYVDGHQHVHQFRGVREELVTQLVQRYAGRTPWLRSTRPPAGGADAKARIIALLGENGLRRRARSAGLRMSAWMVGAYGFGDDAAGYRARLASWMRSGPDGSLLMCHPATRADASDPIGTARTVEFSVLGSAWFDETLRAQGITLATGSMLAGTP
jgi:chitin disaccharide deacetylase